MKKKTVGAIASELQQKATEAISPIDIQREAQKDYIENLHITVNRGKLSITGDFFVVVLLKKEKLLENVLRNYFFETICCPTPDYNQSVFKYHAKDEKLEYLWTVPDEQTCNIFQRNVSLIVPEELELLNFVLQFHDGTLLQKARKLNGEDLKTGIILEGK